MALIKRNEYGIIALNDRVLYKMIAQDLLAMKNDVIPCNKKGKIIKNNPTPFIDPDVYDSIEVLEKTNDTRVHIYVVIVFGQSISETANRIIDCVSSCFNMLQMEQPAEITVHIKGIKARQLVRRDIQINRFR